MARPLVQPVIPGVVVDTTRWVSCSQESDWATAQYRHLLANPLDTLCNASSSYPEVWRGNTRKPKCPGCEATLKRYARKGQTR